MKVPTGIDGFDKILYGGLNRRASYLIKGEPGTGKTIFGLQFLLEGVRRGEKCTFISFDQPLEELKNQAEGFGWDIDKIRVVDRTEDIELKDFGFLDYGEGEVVSFIDSIVKDVGDADRVFIDGAGVIRDLCKDQFLYRRILTTLIRKIGESTILISSEGVEIGRDIISYIVTGEFFLKKIHKNGEVLRKIIIAKFRDKHAVSSAYYTITENGIQVFPLLRENIGKINEKKIDSSSLRNLLKGEDIINGAGVLIAGKSGVGKTFLSLDIARKNKSIYITFEESPDLLKNRAERIFGKLNNVEIKTYKVDNIGEFFKALIDDVKEKRPSVVVIDSIEYLFNIVESESDVKDHLYMISEILKPAGVSLILTVPLEGEMTSTIFTEAGISHIFDYILFGRYVELDGEFLKAWTVIKNRYGDHERGYRILDVSDGLKFGELIKDYNGIISGELRIRK